MKHARNQSEKDLQKRLTKAREYIRDIKESKDITVVDVEVMRAFEELKIIKPNLFYQLFPEIRKIGLDKITIKEILLPESCRGDYDVT